MSSDFRYREEFKRDAVAQVTDRSYSVKEVAGRLGICTKSLYDWKKQFARLVQEPRQGSSDTAEIRRLKAEVPKNTQSGSQHEPQGKLS